MTSNKNTRNWDCCEENIGIAFYEVVRFMFMISLHKSRVNTFFLSCVIRSLY